MNVVLCDQVPLAIPLNQRRCFSFFIELYPSQNSDLNRCLNVKCRQFSPCKEISQRSSDPDTFIARYDARCCLSQSLIKPEHAECKLELQWAHPFDMLVVYSDYTKQEPSGLLETGDTSVKHLPNRCTYY